jgi:hypothetical protein
MCASRREQPPYASALWMVPFQVLLSESGHAPVPGTRDTLKSRGHKACMGRRQDSTREGTQARVARCKVRTRSDVGQRWGNARAEPPQIPDLLAGEPPHHPGSHFRLPRASGARSKKHSCKCPKFPSAHFAGLNLN